MPTITLFGYICRDRNILPDGSQSEIVGGKGLFTAAALSRSGVQTNLVTWLPEKDTALLDALQNYPVTTFVIPIPTGTINTNTHDGDATRATTIMDPMSIEPKHLTADIRSALAQSDGIQISPDLSGKISLETFAFLHNEYGEKISLDAGKYYRTLAPGGQLIPQDTWPERAAYLAHLHTIFLSREDIEPLLATGASLRQIAEEFSVLGPKEVIITLGSKGAFVFDAAAKTAYDIPAFPPKQVFDPTGAGDTFLGAYLGSRAQGHGCESAGRFASMAASAKLNYAGPLRETAEEIEAMLARASA